MSIISEQMFTEEIYIEPKYLNGDINTILHKKLTDKYETYCKNEGYVIKDSISIISKDLGKIQNINNISKILFNVKYKANILNPNVDNVIDCYIDNKNKMGIVAYIKLSEYVETGVPDTLQNSPLLIIIPNDESNENIAVNKIQIKVKAKRLKYRSKFIQIIGEIV